MPQELQLEITNKKEIAFFKHKRFPIFYRIEFVNKQDKGIGYILDCSDYTKIEVEAAFVMERYNLGLLNFTTAEMWWRAIAYCKFGNDVIKGSKS